MIKFRKKLQSVLGRIASGRDELTKAKVAEFNFVNSSDEEVFTFARGVLKPGENYSFLSESDKAVLRAKNVSEAAALFPPEEEEQSSSTDVKSSGEKPIPVSWADMLEQEYDINDLLTNPVEASKGEDREIIIPEGCPRMIKEMLSNSSEKLGCGLSESKNKWVQKVSVTVFDTPMTLRGYISFESDPSLIAGVYTTVQLVRGCSNNASPMIQKKAKTAFQFEAVLQANVYLQNRKDPDLERFVKALNPSLPDCRIAAQTVLTHLIDETSALELLRGCETLTRRRINRIFRDEGDIYKLKRDIINAISSLFDKPEDIYQKLLKTKTVVVVKKVLNPKTKKEERTETRRPEKVNPEIRSFGVPMLPDETKFVEHLNKVIAQQNVIAEIMRRLQGIFSPYEFVRVGSNVVDKLYLFTEMLSKELHARKLIIRNAALELQSKSDQKGEKDLKPYFYSKAELSFDKNQAKHFLKSLEEVFNKQLKGLSDVLNIDISDFLSDM